MINRRGTYRHAFPPEDQIQVHMDTLGTFERTQANRQGVVLVGKIINLSLGGMEILMEQADERVTIGIRLRAIFFLPGSEERIRFDCQVARVNDTDGKVYVGMGFLPLANPVAEEAREKTLWQFLLGEQLRLRRLQREREELGH